ncbi:MAG: hypothetical protein ACD_8C00019G0002 [uncultured bacterium]|nr:MAG: hypothetical protein ACD_8C00019G0002 [uncultured bacterium]
MDIVKKISDKIEEIRNEPEHVRIRWVWISVIVSMLFILAIWIFSMGSLFQGDENKDNSLQLPNITQQLPDLKQVAPSLEDLSEQVLTIENEGVSNKSKTGN